MDDFEEQKGPTVVESPLREVLVLFLRLGLTAFGGPAAHISMFRDEAVSRRKWLTDREFLDFMAATNLIPGPNSTEMAIHLGYLRAGWPGLIVGGVAFILPAFLAVLGIAALYSRFGAMPQAQWLLYGIGPVVIAIILQAVWGLSRTAIKSWLLGIVAALALSLYFFNVNEILLLFAGGLLVMIIRNGRRMWEKTRDKAALLIPPAVPIGDAVWSAVRSLQTVAEDAVPVTLGTLFLTFLKIGSVLYGSGYVLIAFLQTEFVDKLHWITSAQLLDAVAIGQFTPGPVFTTATFIGYLVAGVPGAIVSTIAIFLPSFIFVAVTNPFIPRLRRSSWLEALLEGIVAASLGLMVAVTIDLAVQSIVDIPTALIAMAAAILLIRFRVNSTWLIIGGALVGLGLALFS